ncbi:hypothetical protein M5E87_12215 [Flavonifractor plautii]|nr:hypothetical protein M5E87_12215 [Flavonifractor plautii]
MQKKVPSVEALERLHRLAYSVPDEVQVRSWTAPSLSTPNRPWACSPWTFPSR